MSVNVFNVWRHVIFPRARTFRDLEKEDSPTLGFRLLGEYVGGADTEVNIGVP